MEPTGSAVIEIADHPYYLNTGQKTGDNHDRWKNARTNVPKQVDYRDNNGQRNNKCHNERLPKERWWCSVVDRRGVVRTRCHNFIVDLSGDQGSSEMW